MRRSESWLNRFVNNNEATTWKLDRPHLFTCFFQKESGEYLHFEFLSHRRSFPPYSPVRAF
mgnify:CR=1 FL=1